MQSNRTKLRKKLAKEIEDEIFTIQTTLDNLVSEMKGTDYKSIKRLDYDKLKNTRELLHRIGHDLKRLQNNVETLHDKPFWSETVEVGDCRIFINPSTAKRLEESK